MVTYGFLEIQGPFLAYCISSVSAVYFVREQGIMTSAQQRIRTGGPARPGSGRQESVL